MNHSVANNRPHGLDEQEHMIVRALIRDSRLSDNQIGKQTGVPTPTVRRKRKRLEEAGLLSYFCALDMQETGTGKLVPASLRHQVPHRHHTQTDRG